MAKLDVKLTPNELDDLIYYSRTGDLAALQESITTSSVDHMCQSSDIICSAIDVDEEGLGSGSCLLHYPAANGNTEIVQYLLTQITSSTETSHSTNGTHEGQEGMLETRQIQMETETGFINHRNVSGNTALHWAGMNGHLEIVKALLKAGADPEVVNAAGRDAVVESEWSSKDGAAECAHWMLKECGALEKSVGNEAQEDDIEGANIDDGEPGSSEGPA